MVSDDIEKTVFDLVEEYNGYWFWLRKRYPLKKETDLNADFRMAPEDAAELLENYAEKFSINPKEIDFDKFFPPNLSTPHQPLTISMLIESARAGHWLY
ncbi:DUF1493 family protein [Brenneria tiliae]|uniref:DUF1493 family protein n=1 Tax=Brenneria tiliae TaxID=2914984 RepID=A0ABT0MUQ7_9GAMM|nr:DUF1493 family protein [Brenneria tiliae]MCL2893576.1 DUF1493 family protein [Brenneria tiliae]